MKPFSVPRPEIPSRAWQCAIGAAGVPYPSGVPLGGLGTGCIGRSPQGAFNFWALDVGEQVYQTLPACQFSLFEQPEGGTPQAYALCTEPPDTGVLSSWQWYPRDRGTYAALYPRSWYEYRGVFQSELVCEQFSPVWSGCYQESSYPVAIFNWTVHNPTDVAITISILFTWQNVVGWFTAADKQSQSPYQPRWKESTGNYNQWITDHFRVGCLFNRVRPYTELQEGEGQMAIASITNPALEVYHLGRWNPEGDGAEVWDWFARNGMLIDYQDETPAEPGEQVAAAMAIRFTVRPGRGRKIPFFLAWDFPVLEFAPQVQYFQRHSDFFARTGNNAWTVIRTVLKHGEVWRDKIIEWQRPLLARTDVPDWFTQSLCNRSGYLVAGGTLWTAGTEVDPLGQFGVLATREQGVYESLLPRLYTTFALVALFPRLDVAVLETYSRLIQTQAEMPQNLGSPRGRPWVEPHRSPTPETVRLASAFVLQVYRNFYLTGSRNTDFLWECWGAIAQSCGQALTQLPPQPSPLWSVALAAAIAMGQRLLAQPPSNPALWPPNGTGAIQDAIAQFEAVQGRDCAPNGPEVAIAIVYAQLLDLPLPNVAVVMATLREQGLDATQGIAERLGIAAYFLLQSQPETAWAIAAAVLQTAESEHPDTMTLWLLETILRHNPMGNGHLPSLRVDA